MKKPYFKPVADSIFIGTGHLLVALSGDPVDDVVAGTRDTEDFMEEECQKHRRRRDVWEDEELEEEEYEEY